MENTDGTPKALSFFVVPLGELEMRFSGDNSIDLVDWGSRERGVSLEHIKLHHVRALSYFHHDRSKTGKSEK